MGVWHCKPQELNPSHICRAVDYVGIAEAEEENNIYTSFIAFKVHLERKNPAAACKELCSMLKSADFSVDFLTVQPQQLSIFFLSVSWPSFFFTPIKAA